jgi:hypothetical protein
MKCVTCGNDLRIETAIVVVDPLAGVNKLFDKHECLAIAYGPTSDPLNLTLTQHVNYTRQKAAAIRADLTYGARNPATGNCRVCQASEDTAHLDNCLLRIVMDKIGL